MTATNSAGSASQGFFVGVSAPPPPPSITWDLPSEISLDPGRYSRVDLDLVFYGGVTGWDATSSDEAVVRVSLDGSQVTVTGVAGGSATVTFTATNANGSTSQSITFTVTGPPPTTTTTTVAVAAPTVAATLAARTVTAGATSDVDVAAGFAGTVDSYSATSSDITKLTVSVAGSVVTLSGVAVGSPTVTVTATNTGGEVSQTFTVTVAAPPAPTVAATLAARTVTAGATTDVDVAAGFAGIVDSYSAASSDTTKLTVATTGSVVTLTGVAAGTATVTVTATNTGGSISQTVAVTVEAPDAPTVASTLAAQTVAVGATSDLDVAEGFAGIVDSYSATSGDTTKLTVATDGSVVSLTGVAAGETTVTVTATNTTGSVSQTITVTVREVLLTLTAPSYCLTGEGRPVLITPAAGGAGTTSTEDTTATTSTVGRGGVATVDVSYTISGGRGPYVVTSPATATTAAAGAASAAGGSSETSGVLSVSCALAGVNLDNVDASTNVVEAGPKTISVKVTDADGNTATTTVIVEVAEDAYTTEYNDGTMRAGRTYVLGTSERWALITLPVGLDLRFGGVSDIGADGAAHFFDTVSGSEIVLDWGTGAEVYRNVVAPPAGASAGTARDVAALFGSLVGSVAEPQGVAYGGSEGNDWRPYPGLPEGAFVAVHPSILRGDDPIRVCNKATRSDFGPVVDGKDPYTEFNKAFVAAVDAWNSLLHVPADATRGTPRPVFDRENRCRANSFDISVYYDVDTDRCGSPKPLGCVNTRKMGQTPPMIGGGEPGDYWIYVLHSESSMFGATLLHELGHFIGLGDYKAHLTDCSSDSEKSVMTDLKLEDGVLEPGECGSESLTARDVGDVHAVYHPGMLESALLVDDGGWVIKGVLARDTGRRPEFNLHRLVVWSRSLGSDGAYSFKRAFAMGDAAVSGGVVRLPFVAGFDATGREFLVAGVTRGDPKRRTTDGGGSPVRWVAHADVSAADLANVSWAKSRSWTLGDTVRLAGPPVAPGNVRAVAEGASVRVSWDAVAGATTYRVLWNTATFSDPDDALGSLRVPGTATSWPISGLEGGKAHYFRVEASSGVHDSDLSAVAVATPELVASALSIERSSSSVSEDPAVNPSAEITATLDRAAAGADATVEFTVTRHGGADGDDYVVSPADLEVTVGRGQSEAELTVTAVNDSERESAEWLRITATATGGGIVGELRSTSVTVLIDDNDFAVGIGGVSECVVGESVTLTAAAPLAEPPVRFVWSGAVSATGPSIVFTCPAAGSHGITVVATDDAKGTGSDDHTLVAIAPPPAPATLSVSVTTTTASLSWSDVSTADDYEVGYSGGGTSGSKTTPGLAASFTGLGQWTEYTFEVRARNTAGSSPAVSETKRTSAEITGRVAAVRRTPNLAGHDVEFAFRPTGEDRIEPTRNLVTYDKLEVGRYKTSSDVIRTAATPDQTLGRITVTLSTAGRVLVCFIPHGGARVCPPRNGFPYATAALNRWLYSDPFTFTITDDAAAAGDRDAEDGATMAGASATDEEPVWDSTEGRMEHDSG